jgi:hypothetical protein
VAVAAAGKWLAGSYALVAGEVFLVPAGDLLAPVIHHVLQRFLVDSTPDDATGH